MTKIEKCNRRVNENFRANLHSAFKAKFNLQLETTFSLGTMALVSYLPDDAQITPEQRDFIAAYSDGYCAAMLQISELDPA